MHFRGVGTGAFIPLVFSMVSCHKHQNNEFAFSAIIHSISIMLFDLHVHTTLSACSQLDIKDILQLARGRGLDGVCITDHDTMDIRHQLTEGIQPNGLVVVFGMEYSTSLGDFLVFAPTHKIPPRLSAERLLSTVEDMGGVAVAAHPFRSGRSVSEKLIKLGLCTAVESINGRNTPQENMAVEQWIERYDLFQCGGSDAHTIPELGTYATRFLVPVSTRTDLIQALKHGLCRPEIPTVDSQTHQGVSEKKDAGIQVRLP